MTQPNRSDCGRPVSPRYRTTFTTFSMRPTHSSQGYGTRSTEIGVLPVARLYLRQDDPAPTETAGATNAMVFAVRGSVGEITGWLFSNELTRKTTETPRPKFKCKTCKKDNGDPDSNVCIHCKGPIY